MNKVLAAILFGSSIVVNADENVTATTFTPTSDILITVDVTQGSILNKMSIAPEKNTFQSMTQANEVLSAKTSLPKPPPPIDICNLCGCCYHGK